MLIHLFRQRETTPVCGATARRDAPVREALFRELCIDCRRWQWNRCLEIRAMKNKSEE